MLDVAVEIREAISRSYNFLIAKAQLKFQTLYIKPLKHTQLTLQVLYAQPKMALKNTTNTFKILTKAKSNNKLLMEAVAKSPERS